MSRNEADDTPISALVAQRGIKTSNDFADFMSGLMSDLVENRINADTAKAACMAGDKLLQVVKLQIQVNKDKGTDVPLQLSGVRPKVLVPVPKQFMDSPCAIAGPTTNKPDGG